MVQGVDGLQKLHNNAKRQESFAVPQQFAIKNDDDDDSTPYQNKTSNAQTQSQKKSKANVSNDYNMLRQAPNSIRNFSENGD